MHLLRTLFFNRNAYYQRVNGKTKKPLPKLSAERACPIFDSCE
ncbi:hypothetical protein HMPREF1988_01576 [Porphyromonas gingivalis F0185]|nr:hypothetical protein HMPREF1988_01576 [Porphyromonas gingivalis F0185]